MQKVLCDICEKEINIDPRMAMKYPHYKIQTCYGVIPDMCYSIDLCPNCMENLKVWLKERSTKED